MKREQQERAKILLQATLDILKECSKGMYVENVFEMTAIWDEAECDGYCLEEDIKMFIEELE